MISSAGRFCLEREGAGGVIAREAGGGVERVPDEDGSLMGPGATDSTLSMTRESSAMYSAKRS